VTVRDAVRWDWLLVTRPAQEPITVDEAKAHARITHSRENALVDAYITAARQMFESYTNRAAYTQTWKVQLSGFVDVMPLPMAAPLQNAPLANPSTAPVVQYYDVDDVLQTLDDSYYIVNTTTTPGQIERAPGMSWPSVQCDRKYPVLVTYVAGWSDVTAIPELVKHGIRLWVASQDCDRTGESQASQNAARALWDHYVVHAIAPEHCA